MLVLMLLQRLTFNKPHKHMLHKFQLNKLIQITQLTKLTMLKKHLETLSLATILKMTLRAMMLKKHPTKRNPHSITLKPTQLNKPTYQ